MAYDNSVYYNNNMYGQWVGTRVIGISLSRNSFKYTRRITPGTLCCVLLYNDIHN